MALRLRAKKAAYRERWEDWLGGEGNPYAHKPGDN